MLKIFFVYLVLIVSLSAADPTINPTLQVADTNVTNQETPDNAHLTKWLISNKSELDKTIQDTARESKTKWFSDAELNKRTTPNSVTSPPASKQTLSDDNYIEYTVKKGDTVYSISQKYNVAPDDILTWNSMDSASSLKENQKVKIYLYQPMDSTNTNPNQTTTSTETFNDVRDSYPQYTYYKVKAGDTLNLIAKSHNMTPEELTVLNHLEENQVLSIGMILKVNSNYGNKNPPSNILKDGFAWPAVGRLVMPYGLQEKGVFNEGINLSLKKGTPVKATQDGIITYTGNAVKNFGNIVIVQHDHNWLSVYANLSKTLVKKGDTVKKGAIIARSGDSGNAKSPQLHFELRYNIKPMDPLNYLNSYN
ncbi:peptidoglycan DD-metalloendopeptidase family protein [Candidatus Hepatincola sp. Av]